MFDFLTGFIDILTSIFTAIQNLFNFFVDLLSFVFNYLFAYFGYWGYVFGLIPSTVRNIVSPLLCLALAAAIFRFAGWIKHMIPFN